MTTKVNCGDIKYETAARTGCFYYWSIGFWYAMFEFLNSARNNIVISFF
jgi:hypothetical protein